MQSATSGGAVSSEGEACYEDSSLEEDRMTGIAMLGRLAMAEAIPPDATLPHLTPVAPQPCRPTPSNHKASKLLQTLLRSHAAAAEANPSPGGLRALTVLVSCAGYLLADASEGEKPLVPDAVNAASKQCLAQGVEDPVEGVPVRPSLAPVGHTPFRCLTPIPRCWWSRPHQGTV